MPSKNTTTVVLTKSAQVIKEDLAPIFGLKNILSAGLLLFGKLSDAQQKKAITETAEEKPSVISSKDKIKESLKDAIQMLKEMVEVEEQQPGTVYRVLSREEQAILDNFRKTFDPESEQKRRHKQA